MKTLFSFLVLFAPQIIPLKADIWNKNALVTGIAKPHLQFWRNPFAGSKAKAAKLKETLTGKFRIKGTATLKNGKLKLDVSLTDINESPESALMPPAASTNSATPTQPTSATTAGTAATTATGPTTGTTMATTESGPTSAGGTSTTAGGSTTPTQQSTASSGTTISTVTSAATSGTAATAVTSGPTNGTTVGTTATGTTGTAATTTTTGGSTLGPSTTATSLTPSSTITPGSSTLSTSKPTSPVGSTVISSTVPSAVAASKPTSPGKICIIPGKVYVIIIAKKVMKAHNSFRRTHGSPALQLDEKMICDAQTFAQQMAFKGVLEHQSSEILARQRVGENIGMSCTPARNGPLNFEKISRMVGNVAKRWYDEVCEYNFHKPNFEPRTGHFTEVVWSGSRKLGVGYAVGRNAKFPGYVCVYVVGRYRPAGNKMEEQRLETNVKRGNFNDAYCTRRSKAPAFTLVPVDKRNQMKVSHNARA